MSKYNKRYSLKMILIMILFIKVFCISQDTAKEENLKAVMIYNFTKFMKWPQENIINNFNICVLAGNNIVKPLKDIALKRTTKGKDIIVKEIKSIEDINECCILVTNVISKIVLRDILEKAIEQNFLVIGNKEGLCEEGVPVNFVKINDKIRFEMNITSLKKLNIEANTQLLNLAVKIYK